MLAEMPLFHIFCLHLSQRSSKTASPHIRRMTWERHTQLKKACAHYEWRSWRAKPLATIQTGGLPVLVQNDYLSHTHLYARLAEMLSGLNGNSTFSMVDLGCGDVSTLGSSFLPLVSSCSFAYEMALVLERYRHV